MSVHQGELELFKSNKEAYTIKLNTDRHAIDAEVLGDVLLPYKKAIMASVVGMNDCQSISVDVSTIESGCIEIHSMINVLQSVINPETIPNIIGSVKSIINLFRFLKGQPPESVSSAETGFFKITNCDHATITVNQTIYNNGYLAAGAPPFGIGSGLQKEGVRSVQVFDSKGVEQVKVDACNFASMVSPSMKMQEPSAEDLIVEDELVVETIPIGAPQRKQWSFIRNGQKIKAIIKDADFISKIAGHQISFRQGDRIKARINVHSEFNPLTKCLIVKSHQILNVIKYIPVVNK